MLESRTLLAAPIAAADFYVLTHDRTLNGNSVLGNDSDPDHDPLTAALLTDVAHGTLSLNPNGTFQYVPGVHYAGPDSFTYRAFDGTNYSAPATVTFTVTNSTPAAVGDSYTIYKDVWDSAVQGSLSLLNNDMDQDGDSLAASIATGPAHGSITLNANGSFVYTPNAGYFGPDTLTYRVSDGVTSSATATVNFDVTSPFSVQTNGNDQPIAAGQAYGPFAVSPLTGGTQSSLQVAPGHLLQYSSLTADSRPVIAVETSWNPLTPAPLGIEATLTFNGVQGQTVYFQGANVVAGDKLRFALQADATALPTGHYNWSVTLIARYPGSTTSTRMYSGVSDVVSNVNGEIGAGWSVAELDRLVPVSGGQLFVNGSGAALFFQDNGNNTFTSPAGPLAFATLVRNVDQTFTLTARTGEKETFNTLGLLTSRMDLNSNTVSYTYIDANSDGQARELQKITDPFNRSTTFHYTGGKLSSVTDLAGRVTDLTRDANGQLVSIKFPDPDGTNPLARPETTIAYDASHRLTAITDPVGQQTLLQYAVSGRIKTAIFADGNQKQFVPVQTQGFIDTSSGTGTQANPAQPYKQGFANFVSTNELNQQEVTRTDRFGFVTFYADPLQYQTLIARDANGLPTQITLPDPDGGVGTLVSPVTSTQYDASGNPLVVTYPDGSAETWTWDAILNRPLSHTDQRGKSTTYTYDTKGNLLTATDANGKTTSYMYNSRGQVLRVTTPDPDDGGPQAALFTTLAYDTSGRVIKITNPDASFQQFTYDSRDNRLTIRDELARVTTFAYDLLDRQTSVTRPDPDGTGPGVAPVTSFAYDAASRLTSTTDPYGQLTAYGYNARNWLTTTTLPDPDGSSGPLTSPVTTLAYNAAGLVTSRTDPLGYVTAYDYDANSRLTRVTQPDPDGNGPITASATQFQYDNMGRRTAEVDPRGKSTSYRYNSLNQITEVTTPLGFKTLYSYDSLGNVLAITSPDPDGNGPLAAPIESFSYDNLGRTVSTTDPRGNVTAYAYDNLSRLISVTEPDPDGTGSQSPPVTSYGYNNRGFLTSVTDALGYVTAYTYDVAGQLTKVTEADPDGAGSLVSPVTSYTYDKLGQLTRITAPLSRLTNFSYDVGGRLTSVTDPLSHTTSYAYDALGRTTTITEPDPDGAAPAGPLPAPITTLGYDARGSLISRVDALGGIAAWNFDPMGRIVSETDEAGRTSQYGYDANSQLTTSKDPLLNLTSYQYDDDGRLTRVTQPDPDGNGALPAPYTSSGYDNLGRLSTQTDERGGISTFAYDLNGNHSSLTDPSGNATVYAYDNLDRLVSDTNALGDSRTYGYDALGQLTTQTDRNGRVTNFTFDGLGRMTQEKWLVGSSTVNTLAYTYDAASRLTLASDSYSKYAYTYYASDRVKTVDNNGTPNVPRITLTSSYDNLDRRTQVTASAGAVADFKTNYQYDSLSRVTQITQSASGGAGGNPVAAKRIDFTYDAVGQYAQVNRFADLAGNQLVAGSNYGYDGAGRMTSLTHSQGSTTLNAYTWAYDPLGRPTQQTSADGTDTFSYDPASQVTGATHTSQPNEAYAYDATGNRTNTGYTTGANNRLLSDGTYTYQYDAEGNRTRRTEIATGSYDALAWDHHKRLTSVKSYTAAGVLTKQVQYTYDVYDRRIGRQVDTDGNGTWDSTRRFVYDGEDIVLAYSGSTAGSLTNRYLIGPNTDEILADETVVAGATSAVTWSLADNLGSVRDLVQYAGGTDTTTVVHHLLYDTFGQIKGQSNSAWQPLFAFTGREWDADAGLYFYRARWYDPQVGRFLSEDPIGFAAGDVNLNRYVVNAPTVLVDSSGLDGTIPVGTPGGGHGLGGAAQSDPAIAFPPTLFSPQSLGDPQLDFLRVVERSMEADLRRARERDETQQLIFESAFVGLIAFAGVGAAPQLANGACAGFSATNSIIFWSQTTTAGQLAVSGTVGAALATGDKPDPEKMAFGFVAGMSACGGSVIATGRGGTTRVSASCPPIGLIRRGPQVSLSDTAGRSQRPLASTSGTRQTFASGTEWYEYLAKQYGEQNVEWLSGSGRTIAWPRELPLPANPQMFRVRPPKRSSTFISELESVAGQRPTRAIGHHNQPLGLNGVDNGRTNGSWQFNPAHQNGHDVINGQVNRLPYGTEIRIFPRPPESSR